MKLWSRVGRPAVRAAVQFHRDRSHDRAAVIAYFALVSFFPLAVLLVTMATLVLGDTAAERGVELFFRTLLYRLPPSLMIQIRDLATHVWSSLGYVAVGLWTASKVFGKIEVALDHVFQVGKRRGYATRRVMAMALVGVLSTLVVVSVVVSGFVASLERLVDASVLSAVTATPAFSLLNGFVSRHVVPWSLTVGAFTALYWLVPARAIRWVPALAGGIAAGSLWTLSKVAFTYYVVHLADYARTYGALTTVILFLLWFHLSATLLLWGAHFAALFGGYRSFDSARIERGQGDEEGGAGGASRESADP